MDMQSIHNAFTQKVFIESHPDALLQAKSYMRNGQTLKEWLVAIPDKLKSHQWEDICHSLDQGTTFEPQYYHPDLFALVLLLPQPGIYTWIQFCRSHLHLSLLDLKDQFRKTKTIICPLQSSLFLTT